MTLRSLDLGQILFRMSNRTAKKIRVSNLSPAMGARNQKGIGLSYRPASLCSFANQFQNRFLDSVPLPIAGLKFPSPIYAVVQHEKTIFHGVLRTCNLYCSVFRKGREYFSFVASEQN